MNLYIYAKSSHRESFENYAITQAYPELHVIKPYDASWLEEEIQATFKANEHILPAMDYEFYNAK